MTLDAKTSSVILLDKQRKHVMSLVYTMHIEKPANTIKQHGFHLGTIEHIAEEFVMERLKNDSQIISIALKINNKIMRIYDHSDLT